MSNRFKNNIVLLFLIFTISLLNSCDKSQMNRDSSEIDLIGVPIRLTVNVSSDSEVQIRNLRVLFYDDANEVARVKNLDKISFDKSQNKYVGNDIAKSNENQFTTKEITIDPGSYKIVVMANVNNDVVELTQRGENLSEITDEIHDEPLEYLLNDGYIFMTNADILTVTKIAKQKTIQEVSVRLERSIAKFQLGFSPEGVELNKEFQKNYDINLSNSKYQIDITNQKFYYLRKAGEVIDGKNDHKLFPETDSTKQEYRYAVDPNFDNISITELNDNFKYITGGYQNSAQTLKDPILISKDSSIFIPENTMAANWQRKSTTTRAILELQVTPKGLKNGQTFIQYETANSQTNYRPEQLLNEIESNPKFYNLKQNKTVINYIKQIADSNDETAALNLNKLTSLHLKVYRDGKSFYSLYIRHFNDQFQSRPDGYGRYGIVRNNFYKLTIKKIGRIGKPYIPQIDPNAEIDTKSSEIVWEIEIVPPIMIPPTNRIL